MGLTTWTIAIAAQLTPATSPSGYVSGMDDRHTLSAAFATGLIDPFGQFGPGRRRASRRQRKCEAPFAATRRDARSTVDLRMRSRELLQLTGRTAGDRARRRMSGARALQDTALPDVR